MATGSGKGTDNELVLGISVDAKGAIQVVDSFSKKVESAGTSASKASRSVDNLSTSGKTLGQSYFKAGATLFVFNQAIGALGPLFSKFDQNITNVTNSAMSVYTSRKYSDTLSTALHTPAT